MGKNGKKPKKKTQECLNNIRIRVPTYENECYAKRTRILRTMMYIAWMEETPIKKRVCSFPKQSSS